MQQINRDAVTFAGSEKDQYHLRDLDEWSFLEQNTLFNVLLTPMLSIRCSAEKSIFSETWVAVDLRVIIRSTRAEMGGYSVKLH